MPRRSTRFYRRNEEEVMKKLGLVPTINSGAGWIEKEDGQNDYLIAQLKSTDANSMSVKLRDIQVLELNAATAHKIPLFVIQYLSTDDTFIMCRPTDLVEVAKYISTGTCTRPTDEFNLSEGSNLPKPKIKAVKSSSKSREKYWKGEEEKWKKRKKLKRN